MELGDVVRQSSEDELLRQVAAGGRRARQATTVFYDRYARKFRSYLAFNGVSGTDAEDIVQEVFLNVFRLADRPRQIENAKAYIYGILNNALRDFWRRQARQPMPVDWAESVLDAEDGALGTLETAADRDERGIDETMSLQRCLERAFSAFQQQSHERANVVYLSAVEQFSPREIAEYLGRSYGATREYMSQCMQRFRRYLWEFCKDHVEALLEPQN